MKPGASIDFRAVDWKEHEVIGLFIIVTVGGGDWAITKERRSTNKEITNTLAMLLNRFNFSRPNLA